MSLRRFVLFGVISVFCVSPASAGIIVSMDMDPTTGAIESHRVVAVNDEFAVDIVLTLTGDTSLALYGFGVRFDTEELDFVSRTETPPSPFSEFDKTNPFVDNLGPPYEPALGAVPFGWLQRFDGGTLGDGPVAPAVLRVATLRFKAVQPQGDGSNIDLIAGLFEPGIDGFYANDYAELAPTFQGGSLTVVPEPSSLVLLGIAAVCVGGWHFRRRRKA